MERLRASRQVGPWFKACSGRGASLLSGAALPREAPLPGKPCRRFLLRAIIQAVQRGEEGTSRTPKWQLQIELNTQIAKNCEICKISKLQNGKKKGKSSPSSENLTETHAEHNDER